MAARTDRWVNWELWERNFWDIVDFVDAKRIEQAEREREREEEIARRQQTYTELRVSPEAVAECAGESLKQAPDKYGKLTKVSSLFKYYSERTIKTALRDLGIKQQRIQYSSYRHTAYYVTPEEVKLILKYSKKWTRKKEKSWKKKKLYGVPTCPV